MHWMHWMHCSPFETQSLHTLTVSPFLDRRRDLYHPRSHHRRCIDLHKSKVAMWSTAVKETGNVIHTHVAPAEQNSQAISRWKVWGVRRVASEAQLTHSGLRSSLLVYYVRRAVGSAEVSRRSRHHRWINQSCWPQHEDLSNVHVTWKIPWSYWIYYWNILNLLIRLRSAYDCLVVTCQGASHASRSR